jgi:hypothetical protein
MEWFSICPNIRSKYSTVAILKKTSSNNIIIQMKLVGISLYQTSFVQVQWFMSFLHKTKYEF